MLTQKPEIPSAVESLRSGAFDYVPKPCRLPDLARILLAGIAWQSVRSLRQEILRAPSLECAWAWVRLTVRKVMGPVDVMVILADRMGNITRVLGAPVELLGQRRAFVHHVISTSKPRVAITAADVAALEPVRQDAKSLFALPVRGAGETIGVFSIESDSKDAVENLDRSLVEESACLCGFAIAAEEARQRVIESERHQHEQLRLLYREFRHNIATHAQIVSMQTRELEDKECRSLTATEPGTAGEILRRVRIIRNNADAINSVTEDLKNFSSVPEVEKERFDLVELVRTCIDEMSDDFQRSEIGIVVDKPAGRLDVDADRIWIDHTVRCLLRNAVDAIDQCRAQRVDGEPVPREIRLRWSADSAMVHLAIQDTGIGFDPEQRETLFLPLFTTKSRTKAAGEIAAATGSNRVEQILSLMADQTCQYPIAALGGKTGPLEIIVRETPEGSVHLWARKAGKEEEPGRTLEQPDLVLDRLPPSTGNRGIGLYSARRVVVADGGTISADSAGLWQGATFTLSLPHPR